MSLSPKAHFTTAQYYELLPRSFDCDSTTGKKDGAIFSHTQVGEYHADNTTWKSHEPPAYPITDNTFTQRPEAVLPQLGRPRAMKRLSTLDACAASISVICAITGVLCVTDDTTSWYLSANNRQLVVLGLLLSIMSLCVGTIYPTLFLLLEARFGQSTLQNYDGILRNSPFGSRLTMAWRFALGLMLAMPLGLSVAYKQFAGGYSAKAFSPREFTGNESYYGMFAPPGLMGLGYETGLTVFSNATLPFQVATSPINGVEPPMPRLPHPYGFNILLLNGTSSAVLDIPQSSYIEAVQRQLLPGESWNITADVLGTIATLNESVLQEQRVNSSYFMDFCRESKASNGANAHISLIYKWCVVLINRPSPGDASEQYVALAPDPGLVIEPTCSDLAPYAQPFYVTRQSCTGRWSLTRESMQLVGGHCDSSTVLPPEQQLVITSSRFWLPVTYMSPLAEVLGPFAFGRNNSAWTTPYMATAIATMLWSRVAAASNLSQAGVLWDRHNITYEQAQLIYTVQDQVMYKRPVLLKAPALILVIVVSPILLLLMLSIITLLHATPLDKGFGLVSILGGIDSKSLRPLAGSTLSGELSDSVKLVIEPCSNGTEGTIQYRVVPMTAIPSRGEKLRSGTVYH